MTPPTSKLPFLNIMIDVLFMHVPMTTTPPIHVGDRFITNAYSALTAYLYLILWFWQYTCRIPSGNIRIGKLFVFSTCSCNLHSTCNTRPISLRRIHTVSQSEFHNSNQLANQTTARRTDQHSFIHSFLSHNSNSSNFTRHNTPSSNQMSHNKTAGQSREA